MVLTLNEIAKKINAEVIGDESLEISGVSSFEDAGFDQITFAVDAKFLKNLKDTKAGAVIIPLDYDDFDQKSVTASILKIKNPKLHFFRILALFNPPKQLKPDISTQAYLGKNFAPGADVVVSPNVTIGDDVVLGDRVTLMPGVYIGDSSVIGDDTFIKPNTTLMERTVIGRRVVIHSGTVIGSDGFGFTPDQVAKDAAPKHEKIPHAGFVQIDDDVEIGACNTIDRGTFGRTWIKKGVKTDNLVHIAHNVTIGTNTLIVAQAGIAGSTKIGKNVILAGRAGVSGHLSVGDFSIVGPGAGVLKDVAPGEIVSGFPSMPHKLWLKVGSIIPRLPDIRKRLISLEKKSKRP